MDGPGQAAPGSLERAGQKWRDLGTHYAERRFASPHARERDAKVVAALLRELRLPPAALVLDAPCGTGRLRAAIESSGARCAGLDASPSMLARATEEGASRLALGSLGALPYRDGAFEAAVACRILHHLDEPSLRAAVRELARVSRAAVICSFWDAGSLAAWRVRAGLKPSEGQGGRRAHPREVVRDALGAAGAARVEFRAVLRFVSQQTFALARL